VNPSVLLTRQGHRLLQLGVALLLFTALEGFVLPSLPVPRLGLAAHTRGASQGVMFLAFGLLWPRLKVGVNQARIAFWGYIYSMFATLLAYSLAALWGAGNVALPLAAGAAHGTAQQEEIINVLLISTAPTFLVAAVVILWGLRLGDTESTS
jgi:hydroxylaminobenzene mutase